MLLQTCHSGVHELTLGIELTLAYLERDVNWRNSGSVDALFLPDRSFTSKTFSETTVVELTE